MSETRSGDAVKPWSMRGMGVQGTTVVIAEGYPEQRFKGGMQAHKGRIDWLSYVAGLDGPASATVVFLSPKGVERSRFDVLVAECRSELSKRVNESVDERIARESPLNGFQRKRRP